MAVLDNSQRTAEKAGGRGAAMHALLTDLFPICRSITGDGVRQSLDVLKQVVPLTVHAVPSGTRAFDWTVPDEWNVRDAWVMDADGNRVIDFRENNLHLVSYSIPFEGEVELEELQTHLHTRPDLPDAIPYVTSYYQQDWGFCLSHRAYEALRPGRYRIGIDATLAPGSLTYGELLIPGESEQEILLSTNFCHPSMANNELSGPVLTTFLAQWLLERPNRRYSYRIAWLPETIGAIVYISRNLEALRRRTVAGYQVVCTGGPGPFHYLQSRQGDAVVDRVTRNVLRHCGRPHEILDYRDRESDERQYCAPGVDLPFGSLMKAAYRRYPEYHTSLDNLELVSGGQLEETFGLYTACLEALEANRHYRATRLCEPQLGRRNLWPNTGSKPNADAVGNTMALLSYSDGRHDLIDIADLHGVAVTDYIDLAGTLVREGLLAPADEDMQDAAAVENAPE